MSFKSLKSARVLTRHIGSAAFAAAICVAAVSVWAADPLSSIDGTKVTFSAEDIASLATTRRNYTLVKAANGGTITGNLLQPDTDAALPTGWHVTQTPGSVTLRKSGIAIFLR